MNNRTDETAGSTGQGAHSSEAATRRRLLLKTLGKGGAVVAAASPLASFAAPSLLPTSANTLCTVSGFKSSLASRAPVGTTACGGFAPQHFVSGTNTIQNMPVDATLFNPDVVTFAGIFGSGSSNTVSQILINQGSGDEAFVLAAYLYAYHLEVGHGAGVAYPAGTQAWPYNSRSYITGFYADPTVSPQAIEFYRLVLSDTSNA